MAGVDLRTGVKPIGVSRGPSGVTGDLGDRGESHGPAHLAVGDVAGSPQFTHVSLDDYRIRSRPFREPARSGTRAASGRQSWTADAAVHPILRE